MNTGNDLDRDDRRDRPIHHKTEWRPPASGGRSAGARVACRTAAKTDSVGVLCLAFPLHPPGRPEKSRLPELDAVTLPNLVVQGDSDPFGTPPSGPGRTVARIPGTHSLKNTTTVAAAVSDWLATMLSTLRKE